MVELAEWMYVGLSLFSMVRLVVSNISLSAIPELFVVLQLKSCLGIKISQYEHISVVVSDGLDEFSRALYFRLYMDVMRRVVDRFKNSVVAMYLLFASSS